MWAPTEWSVFKLNDIGVAYLSFSNNFSRCYKFQNIFLAALNQSALKISLSGFQYGDFL